MPLQRRAQSADADGGSTSSDAVPGKETQIDRLAAQGVSGAPQALPFGDQIAASFGPAHGDTVHGIGAHTGAAATAASEDIGAQAYATGNQVAFGGAPDLHTAAHEAAHVVQQKQGVSLKGGVGAAGDQYEQHADAVADLVVQGKSAAPLLGEAGSASASPAVQRKDAPKGAKHDPKKDAADFESAGQSMVYALAGVFAGDHSMMDYAPAQYKPAVQKLYTARTSQYMDGRQRRALFDEVYPVLEPFVRANDHFGGADVYLPEEMEKLRKTMIDGEANARVDNTILIGAGKDRKAVEIPDDSHPREQAAALRPQLPKLIEAAKQVNEQIIRLGSAQMEEVVEHAMEGHMPHGVKAGKGTMRFAELQSVLMLADGWLTLTDEELQHEIGNFQKYGLAKNIANFSELVKGIAELGGGAVGVIALASSAVARLAGDAALASSASAVAAKAGHTVGSVVAAIEIVHGIAVLLDPSASRQKKMDAAVEVGAGAAFFVSGAAASLALTATYALVKAAGYLYSEAAIGWEVGVLREMFDEMSNDTQSIMHHSDETETADKLALAEHDPEKQKALQGVGEAKIHQLSGSIDSFLDKCKSEAPSHGWGKSNPYRIPGNVPFLADWFAPLQGRRGATSKEDVLHLAADTLKKITWVFAHAADLPKAMATNMGMPELQQQEDKRDQQAAKGGGHEE